MTEEQQLLAPKIRLEEAAPHYAAVMALRDLAEELSARFKFDNEEHDTGLFMERCGLINLDA